MAIPDLNKIKTKFEKDNFKIYGVEFIENYSKDDLKKYITDQKILYPNLYRGKAIASNYGVKLGVPAIIPEKYFNDLLLIKGDQGAKIFINKRKSEHLKDKA